MKLTHPDTGAVIDVLPGSESHYISNGWRPVESKPRKHDDAHAASDPIPEGDK